MRTASAQALHSGRVALDASLAGDCSAERVAEELFALADMLIQHGSLRRSFADPARSRNDKEKLVTQVLENHVTSPTVRVMKSLISERWSSDIDLCRALQELGFAALIDAAAKVGKLEKVQHELGHIRNLLRESRDLRIALSPASQYDDEQRMALVKHILGTKITPETLQMTCYLVGRPQHMSLVSALDRLASEVAHAREKRLVRVTSATPLSDTQLERLHRILSKKYGPVTINTAVNPDFLGGMRVRVGSDAIDGTLQASIASVKQRLGV